MCDGMDAVARTVERRKIMYEGPIELIYSERMKEIKNGVDDTIFRAVMNVGIEVDKEELIKALEYDRDQYEKGYADGRKDAQQWVPCSERQPEKDGRYWAWCEIFIVPDHVDDPCSYYGSREASYLGGHWYGDSIGEVVAWMELPEAWKGSEDKEC